LSLRDGPIGDIKVPLRWTAAVALIVALIAALALFLGDRRGTIRGEALGAARAAVERVAAPAGEVLSAPVRWAAGASAAAGDYVFAARQNASLRRQLLAARGWRDRAMALQNENARYRALMGVATDPPIPMVFARTVIDARGAFANSRLADVGAERGVIEGAPALSEHGLVGRVTGVGRRVSRIMLIARTNARAILTGDGGPNPALAYLRAHDPLIEGDLVMTSGDGGVYPRGLPVGVVAKGLDGVWRVILDADSGPIDYVQILLFRDFSQLVAPGALAPRTLPSAMTEEASPTILGPAAAPAAKAPAPPPAVAKARPAAIGPASAEPGAPKPRAPPVRKSAPKPASKPAPRPAPKPSARRGPAGIGDILDRP
jgi:rod shape-determining protein MreC